MLSHVIFMALTGAPGCAPGKKADVSPEADTASEAEGTCEGFEGAVATQVELASTPREDAEAESLALCMTNGLVASDEGYERAAADLPVIVDLVEAEGDEVELSQPIDWEYVYSQQVSLCSDDPDVSAALKDETYADWKCMNDYYEATGVHGSPIGCAYVYFEGLYNPLYLVEEYLALPGIDSARVEVFGITDGPWLRMTQEGDTIHYVFDLRGGIDCPSGCTEGVAYYLLSTEPGSVVLVDKWKWGEIYEGEAEPAWTEYAQCAWFDLYADLYY